MTFGSTASFILHKENTYTHTHTKISHTYMHIQTSIQGTTLRIMTSV